MILQLFSPHQSANKLLVGLFIRVLLVIWMLAGTEAFAVENTAGFGHSSQSVPDHNRSIIRDSTYHVFIVCIFNHGYRWTDNMLLGIDDAFAASRLTVIK